MSVVVDSKVISKPASEPRAPVAPVGNPKEKSNVAALDDPEFETAAVADPPTETVLGVTEPTAIVAAAPLSPDLVNETYMVSPLVHDPLLST